MTRKEMLEKIKKVKQEVIDNHTNDCVRELKTWSYNMVTKMFITGVELTDNGFANVDVAIEVAQGTYAEESFHFKYEGSGKGFWEKFLEKVVPDQTKAVSVVDLIGKSFMGQIVQNEGYDNLVALDSCDEADGEEGFYEVDADELPFE